MLIEVRNRPPQSRPVKFNNKRTGATESFTVMEQDCLLRRSGDDVPDKFTLQVERDSMPYAPGIYTLDDSVFSINEYGRLSLESRYGLKLVPVPSAAAAGGAPAAAGAPSLQRAAGQK